MIFFAYKGSLDEIHALSLSRYGTWYAFPVVSGAWLGIINSGHQQTRSQIDALHPALLSMPGPHGKLNEKHAALLAANGINPKAKASDPFGDTLAIAFAASGDHRFNPDAY